MERDREMEILSQQLGIPLGSGYPHDPLSIQFIRDYVFKYGKAPTIARTSWITTQRILDSLQNNSM